MNDELLCVNLCRTGRVFEWQIRNNDMDKVKVILRKGFDRNKFLIKMIKGRCK